ncbi:MAG: MFS transporter [Thermoprotei archaeon]|nr:MAG: MFS transporter [Thermoprotei archaeon]
MEKEVKRTLHVFSVAILPFTVCSGMVYSVLPIYFSLSLGASTTQIGLVFTIGAAVAALASPSTGRLSDRFGRRRVVLASMAGFAAAFAMYAAINSIVEAALIQILEGATWAALGSSASAYIADLASSEERGWALGVYHRSYYAGWIIGPALGGYLADVVGFRGMLLVGSGLVVIGLIATCLCVKEPRRHP